MSCYQVNDIVLAADCGKLHEAKILKVQSLGEDGAHDSKFFIHYQGWQRKYDTWIDEHLIAPINDKRKAEKLQDKAEEMWNPSAKREEKASKGNGNKRKTTLHFGGNKSMVVGNGDEDEEHRGDEKGQGNGNGKRKRGGGGAATGKKGSGNNNESEELETESHVGGHDSSQLETSSPVTSRRGRKKRNGVDETDASSILSAEPVASASSVGAISAESEESSKKRRKMLLLADLIDEDDTLYSGRVQIPFNLKRHLVDEWSLVAKDAKRVVQLPKKADKNIRSVVKSFLEMKKGDKNFNEESFSEYVQFMSIFLLQFDRALPTLLLFRQERQQYDNLCKLFPKVSTFPSLAYGAEHLLRFFVRLPKLLYGAIVPQQDMDQFIGMFNELIKFIGKTSEDYMGMTLYVPVEDGLNNMDAENTAVLDDPLPLVSKVTNSIEIEEVNTKKKKAKKSVG